MDRAWDNCFWKSSVGYFLFREAITIWFVQVARLFQGQKIRVPLKDKLCGFGVFRVATGEVKKMLVGLMWTYVVNRPELKCISTSGKVMLVGE